jgi:hypothetical protein
VQSCPASQDSSQSGDPLQVSVQSLTQPVILHDCEPVHVSVQSLPAQSREQEPPVQISVQSPPGHCMEQSELVHVRLQSLSHASEHDAELVQVWTQSPPGHDSEHVEPAAQPYWQSPLPWQVSVHDAPAAQLHVPLAHAKPEEPSGASLPPPSLEWIVLVLPLQPSSAARLAPTLRSIVARVMRPPSARATT